MTKPFDAIRCQTRRRRHKPCKATATLTPMPLFAWAAGRDQRAGTSATIVLLY